MANPLAPNWSMIANRKDKANQKVWTEYRQYGYVTGGTPLQANGYVILGPDGKIDPSLFPSESSVRVNGTPITNPNFNNTTPAAPSGFTNVIWQFDGSGNVSASYATSGVTASFGSITSGTNTTAAMVVGSGASITVACPGSGVIEATELATDNCAPVATNISHPVHAGQLLISQPGNTSAAWADPQVQGLYPAGSNIASPPAYTPPTTICPVLVGGEGTSPSGKDGLLHPLPLTAQGQASFIAFEPEWAQNSANFDPYQRLRVSTPVTLFDESAQFAAVGVIAPATPLNPTQFVFTTTGSAQFSRPASFANITCTIGGDAGARGVWQTRSYFVSQVGKGFLAYLAGRLGPNITNVIARMGMYDDDHGGFFEQNGVTGTLRVVFRSNGVDTGVNQANWNIDKLDGTGFSGVTLNSSNGQFFVLDAGIGRIRFGVAVNGVVYYCHAISVTNAVPAIANTQSIVPSRFELLNSGASAGASMWQAYVSVIVESGFEDNPSAFAFSANTGGTLKTGITTTTPILSITPSLTLQGHPNRAFITLRDFSVFNQGQTLQYQLVWNGTLTGANFQSVDPQSGVLYDTAATTITGGRVVDSGYIAAFGQHETFSRDQFPFRLPFTLQDVAGTVGDTYTIVVTPMSASATAAASFRWQELR